MLAAYATIRSRYPKVLMAEDSTSMVMTAVYKPLGPDDAPMAFECSCYAGRVV